MPRASVRRWRAEHDEGRERERRRAPEPGALGGERAAAADPRVAMTSACRGLDDEQHEAERGEHHAERGGRRTGEGRLVRHDDRGGERVEPDEGECAVLGQQVQRDDQAAAEDGESELRQDDPAEHRPRAEPE